MAKKTVHNWLDSTLRDLSPQQAIGILNDIINSTPVADRQYLKIEQYADNHGNPFEQNPDRCLRVIIDKTSR